MWYDVSELYHVTCPQLHRPADTETDVTCLRVLCSIDRMVTGIPRMSTANIIRRVLPLREPTAEASKAPMKALPSHTARRAELESTSRPGVLLITPTGFPTSHRTGHTQTSKPTGFPTSDRIGVCPELLATDPSAQQQHSSLRATSDVSVVLLIAKGRTPPTLSA